MFIGMEFLRLIRQGQAQVRVIVRPRAIVFFSPAAARDNPELENVGLTRRNQRETSKEGAKIIGGSATHCPIISCGVSDL